jgi:CubicO group peptidase (beta-lactamase class C family)
MFSFLRRLTKLSPRRAGKGLRPTCRLEVEPLEDRQLLDGNPIGSAAFQSQLTQLLRSAGVPQGSVALMYQNQVYTAGATNRAYFRQTHQKVPAAITPDSLFRLASLSKPFVGAAVMSLVQDRVIKLTDNPFLLLGYHPGQTISGLSPLNPLLPPLSATLPTGVSGRPAPLFDITIQNLLQMQSGLPGAVPVTSGTFPDAADGPVYQKEGSYAALAFAGVPPYGTPADDRQQLNYYLYQVAANPGLLQPPRQTYDYEDWNFQLAAMVVDRYSGGLGYMGYLQQKVLGPMGILPPSPPGPAAGAAMIGPSHTLQSQNYPTEVTYYMPAGTPTTTSILPDPNKTVAPFYPDQLVQVPYGGANNQHLDALVATPTALATFMANLENVFAGQQGTGPLSRESVGQMLREPESGPDLSHGGWFGLGLEVFPDPAHPNSLADATWTKGGDEPGTLTSLKRYPDGSIIAIAFNLDATKETPTQQDPNPSGLPLAVEELVQGYAFGPSGRPAVRGSGQTTPVHTAFPLTFQVRWLDFFGEPARGLYAVPGTELEPLVVTFRAPSRGPGGLFVFAGTQVTVTADPNGVATAPPFVANGVAGSYVVFATVDSDYAPFVAQPGEFSLTNFSLTNTKARPPVAGRGSLRGGRNGGAFADLVALLTGPAGRGGRTKSRQI